MVVSNGYLVLRRSGSRVRLEGLEGTQRPKGLARAELFGCLRLLRLCSFLRGAWSVERRAWSVERGASSVERTTEAPPVRAANHRVKKVGLEFRLKIGD